MHRFVRNGKENGKYAWLVQSRALGTWMTLATIVWDGAEWILRSGKGRIDRFEHLSEAKKEALKLA